MNRLIITIIIAFLSIGMYADDNKSSVETSAIRGRFEIIQSPLARKYTIKLDKCTGDTWLMVLGQEDQVVWEKLYRQPVPSVSSKNDNTINYQIFMGGTYVSDMFLIEMNTGITWKLVNDPTDNSKWWREMKTK